MNHWTRYAGRATVAGLLLSLGAVAVVGVVAAFPAGHETHAAPPEPFVFATGAGALGQVAVDHAHIRGSETCRDCHAAEYEAWKQSTHYATWDTMHRRKDAEGNALARDIVKALGLKGSIKRNDTCFQCHYTAKIDGDEPKPFEGVSCESCHGAGEPWVDLHATARDAPDAAQREAILAQSATLGMLRPANVYLVARNCFSCHTVPNEELVNTGGHKAGSDFELVAWSQGEVRHNYQYSEDQKNRPASAERLRVLYVVGLMTDLEYSLRGLARATTDGTYRTAMTERVGRAADRVQKLLETVDLPALKAAVPADGEQGSSDSILAAADKLSEATKAFAATADGASLAAVDALLPSPDTYRGTAHP